MWNSFTDLGSLIENTQCENFKDFSATQILREINFGHFEAIKTAILTIIAAVKIEFLGPFDIFKPEMFPKIKIQSLKNSKNDT